jgi:hypothetical protein
VSVSDKEYRIVIEVSAWGATPRQAAVDGWDTLTSSGGYLPVVDVIEAGGTEVTRIDLEDTEDEGDTVP